MKPIYIQSIKSIIPAAETHQKVSMRANEEQYTYCLKAQEPNYAELLNPNEIRRIARPVKMGTYCAQVCINEQAIQNVDGIIVGSGQGGVEFSERFLCSILRDESAIHSPTAFFQSLPNNISGQIALGMKCYNYNMTYSHKGVSFESALIDAMLLMQNNEAKTVMVGGVDEITPYYVEAMKIAGNLKTDVEAVENAQSSGVILGEGATFVLASTDGTENHKATIKEVKTFFRPKDASFLEVQIDEILEQNELSINQINHVLLGNSGDAHKDKKLKQLTSKLFSNTEKTYFKNLCGEYHTATGFALQQAVDLISIHDELSYNVLIINHYQDTNYSILLISK